MPDKDYYKILGVNKNASDAEIKRAFRTLAQKYHPDKSGGNAEKFKEVNEAHQILSNPEKRKMYDQYGSAFEQAQARGGVSGFDNFGDWASWAQATQGSDQRINVEDLGFGDLGDLLGDLFGSGRRSGRGTVRQGRDINIELSVEFREAIFGTERNIRLDKYLKCDKCNGSSAEPGSKIISCSQCNGSGQVIRTQSTFFGSFHTASICTQCQGQGKIPEKRCSKCRGQGRVRGSSEIKIKIPAGINNGQSIKVSGQGETGETGAPEGDLYITVLVRTDPEFIRKGYDIFYEQGISISQAVLGGKIEVKTLDGSVKLKIPSGTLSGQQFRLKGKGVPRLSIREISTTRGDLIVTVKIKVPKKLTRNQKKLFEQLGELNL